MIYSWKKIVKNGLPLLTVCIFIEIFAGQLLQNNQEILVLYPIFLISIPVVNSVAGNIGSVLGARLASGLHVGYITVSLKDKEMHENLIVSIFISIVIYLLLGFIIFYIYNYVISDKFYNLDFSFFIFLVIFSLSGILVVLVVSVVSIFTAFISFKRGLDPDDMVSPVVTTVGDLIGILFLFLLIDLSGIL